MSGAKKKKILITGGTGYLGSNIINTLQLKYDFIVVKRESSNLAFIEKALNNILIYNFSELTDKIVQDLGIDAILHCATHYGRKNSDPADIIESNLMLPLKLISIVKRFNPSVKFINTDTILDKNINVYSLSKSQFKEWMRFFSSDAACINIQLEHFYGPQDDKTKFVSFLIDSFIKEVPYLNLTAGEQNRYFTHIDDVVSAFDLVISNIDNFNVGFTDFQVSSDEPINLKIFIQTVQKLTGNNTTRLNFGAIPYRTGELMNFKVDCSAIKNLGWMPLMNLEDGLLQTITKDKNIL